MQQVEEYVVEEDFDQDPAPQRGSWRGKWLLKIEDFVGGPFWVVLLIILVGLLSFVLGRISKMGEAGEPVRIISDNSPISKNNPLNPPYTKGETGENNTSSLGGINSASVINTSTEKSNEQSVQVVGSKNGTKYHLPTCPGAKQISDKNKITFASTEEARARGYTPASNCKGLQ